MKNRLWTDAEVSQLRKEKAAGVSAPLIAEALSRTTKSVEIKAAKLGLKAAIVAPVPKPDSFDSSQGATPADLMEHWRKRAGELQRALDNIQHSQIAADIAAENIVAMAPKSYEPAPPVTRSTPSHEGSSQSAVLLLSDTHIGSVVKAEQTLGLGGYNFEVFLRRLARLERAVTSIVQDHTSVAVSELVIPILGDCLDGALQHSAESGQPNPMLAQFYSGGHALAQFLRNISVLAPLRLYGVVGNHPRWQNQKKMPTQNRNSNFDALLYLYVQALVRDIPAIKWHLDWQPFATFDVQGFPFYCLHGENLRGGDRVLGLPAHAMGRMVSTTTQLFARAGRETPAYYCTGHLHRPISIPHARGEVIVNGAFPGIDGYSLGEFFNSSYPSQKFFFMHPKFGRAANYDVRLDFGDEIPHEYVIPKTFECV